jgi:hypothetical protein
MSETLSELMQAVEAQKAAQLRLDAAEAEFIRVQNLAPDERAKLFSGARAAHEAARHEVAGSRVPEILERFEQEVESLGGPPIGSYRKATLANALGVREQHEGQQFQEYLGDAHRDIIASLLESLVTFPFDCQHSAGKVPLTQMTVVANFDATGRFVSLELEPF